MRMILALGLASLSLAACETRDIRAEQQAECRQKGGHYAMGESWDDDVCVINANGQPPREVIIFDNRETDEDD